MRLDQPTSSVLGVLTLLGIPGVGPIGANRLVATFSVLEEVHQAPFDSLRMIAGKRAATAMGSTRTWQQAHQHATELLTQTDRLGARAVACGDAEYPERLRAIADRPPVVYVKGTLTRAGAVACVGTREPSEFGKRAATSISQALAMRRITVVSGLAHGVDTLCHEAALRASGHTVAVLAGGLEKIYPAGNRDLADEIVATGGALLTEQPLGAPPSPRNLVRRDRLQSALSGATVVMQTGVAGGTMHTVRFTLLQGRLLFVPRPSGRHAEHEKSKGLTMLLERNGREIAEILDARGEYADLLRGDFGNRSPAIPIEDLGGVDQVTRLVRHGSSAQRRQVSLKFDAEDQ